MRIPFNRPLIGGREFYYIAQVAICGNPGGGGLFIKRSAEPLQKRFAGPMVPLTPSCTFVSTASAFVRLGVRTGFFYIRPGVLSIDNASIGQVAKPRIRAICLVQDAGFSCEMDRIMAIARACEHPVVEAAAQGVSSWYSGRLTRLPFFSGITNGGIGAVVASVQAAVTSRASGSPNGSFPVQMTA